jgi:soluble P-type ATPase
MLRLNIPNYDTIMIEHLLLDFNGTIAIDGKLVPGVAQRLEELSSLLTIHVITADTNGTARSQLENIPCTIKIISDINQDRVKIGYARDLGLSKVVAIGNGTNDFLMLKKAALSIGVIQTEGAAAKTMQAAKIICNDIKDALDLLLRHHRLTATLRN